MGEKLSLEESEKAKSVYLELFQVYKDRVKTKHFTKEVYDFDRQCVKLLVEASVKIVQKTWKPGRFFPFQTTHPVRTISAPQYIDRVVEQWYVEKYIRPVMDPQMYEFNMACQQGKGPFLVMDWIRAVLMELYLDYGTDFYIYQGDLEGYFDNMSHIYAKDLFRNIIEPDMFWLYENVVDHFHVDGYAQRDDPLAVDEYGFPKGNLPSQWTGIVYFNDLGPMISSLPGNVFNIYYMDDILAFFPCKAGAAACRDFVRRYFNDRPMGVRMHQRKTNIFPMSRGFTFCGWHYFFDKYGGLHIQLREERRDYMEQRLKTISREVKEGAFDIIKANEIRDGMFAYLLHGTDSRKLIRYMLRQYPFPIVRRNAKTKMPWEKMGNAPRIDKRSCFYSEYKERIIYPTELHLLFPDRYPDGDPNDWHTVTDAERETIQLRGRNI